MGLCFALPLLGLVLPPLVHAQAELLFQTSWDSRWRLDNSGGYCQLSLPLAEYGEARFVASSHSRVNFELQANKDLFAPGAVRITRFPPDWLPNQHPRAVAETGLGEALLGEAFLGEAMHIQGGGAIVRGQQAGDLLWALRQGFNLRLSAPAAHRDQARVAIEISATGIGGVIEGFLRCARTPVRVAWQEMARTRIAYPVDEYVLSAEAKAALAPVISFVRQDPTIKKIYIDGHTDGSGDQQRNYVLSKRRAEAVAAHIRQGLGEGKDRLKGIEMVLRYHGAAYPVAKNDTPEGKAQNRRTTVRLEREEEALLAGHQTR